MNADRHAAPAHHLWVVEDDDDDRLLIADTLRECAFPGSVRMFDGGVEMLSEIDKNDDLPDLVLLDLNLPVISGLATLRRLRAHDATRQVPVIILTTSDNDDDVKRAYAAGANAYLRKPSSFEGMVERFRKLLAFWVDAALLPR
jgi:two-component system response regulator